MVAQEPKLANPAGHSATLPVAEVVAIVREWVDLHARHLPDFAGAYLWGGITALPPDAPFHLYRDVDVVVVLTHGAQDDNLELLYRGLLLEVISKNLDAHEHAEAVLADPSAGPNLATTQILADPTGVLEPLHQAVAADYGRRRWIWARCEAEKASARSCCLTVWMVPLNEWHISCRQDAPQGMVSIPELSRAPRWSAAVVVRRPSFLRHEYPETTRSNDDLGLISVK
jgi:hypothetical protein